MSFLNVKVTVVINNQKDIWCLWKLITWIIRRHREIFNFKSPALVFVCVTQFLLYCVKSLATTTTKKVSRKKFCVWAKGMCFIIKKQKSRANFVLNDENDDSWRKEKFLTIFFNFFWCDNVVKDIILQRIQYRSAFTQVNIYLTVRARGYITDETCRVRNAILSRSETSVEMCSMR